MLVGHKSPKVSDMAQPNRQAIETLRVETGLKRTPFAERVGISYNHLYGIERGQHVASRELLSIIAGELTTLLKRPIALCDVLADDAEQSAGAA